jgi:hypothetical protein
MNLEAEIQPQMNAVDADRNRPIGVHSRLNGMNTSAR